MGAVTLFRAQGLGFRVSNYLGLRVEDVGVRAQSFRCSVRQ